MTMNRSANDDRFPTQVAKTIHDHWALFLAEGAVLVLLGIMAVTIPSISSENFTGAMGWIFLVSGAVGLGAAYWARQAPGFWWSLVSALLALFVGIVLVANRAYNLYGGMMGWPFENVGPLRTILVLFFLVEGLVSIMFAFEHRHHLSGRWLGMLASGAVDIVLAVIIIFDLPGSSAWTMGLLVCINMILGGVALIAMGLHARAARASDGEISVASE
jgi:uncharacterized membrane protein HdeD (DUF308 family)